MQRIIKGSDLTVGQTVAIVIRNERHEATEVFGQITGIQEWTSTTIAIQFQGLGGWIVLGDNVEVGLA